MFINFGNIVIFDIVISVILLNFVKMLVFCVILELWDGVFFMRLFI